MSEKRKKTTSVLGYLLLTFLLLATAVFLIAYLTLNSLRDKTSWVSKFDRDVETIENVKAPDPYKYHPRTNFLILGSDNSDGVSRTDAIIVVSVDDKNANAALISIPRDTLVQINNANDKLNAVYPKKGINETIKVVEQILNIPIHNYVKMDYQGFEKIINTLGGVIIDVEMPMVYDDYAQKLHIRIMPGKQRLSGEQALHYVRFRGDGFGDVSSSGAGYVGRVVRQQKFIEALVNEVSRPSNVGKLPSLATQLKDAIRTNMAPAEILKWAQLAQNARGFQIKSFVAPGEPATINQGSYWLIDNQRLEEVINQYFRVGKYGFSVSILNGSGKPEAARELAESIREKGYRLTGISEVAEYQYYQTTIQASEQFEDAVNWLKVSLGLKDIEWTKVKSSSGDISILLGRDILKK